MSYELLGHSVDLDPSRVADPPETVQEQLREYAAGARRRFDLTIALSDGFLGGVQRELRSIPYGETRTYGDVADRLGTAPIAVGQACARNPLPVVVPCHRVVGSESLRGYMYPGLQAELLELERQHGRQRRPDDPPMKQ